MTTPGFQWFVAWRYLLARPRKISTAVAAVAMVFYLAAALGFALDWALWQFMLREVPTLARRPELIKMFETVGVPTAWWTTYALAAGSAALLGFAGTLAWIRRHGGGIVSAVVATGFCTLVVVAAAWSMYCWLVDPGVATARQTAQLVAGIGGLLCELALLLGGIRYFFTFFTTVSMGGVAIGSMALVIVLSIMNGFETDLRDKILGSNAHLRITKVDGEFTEYREVGDKIAGVPDLIGYAPYATSEVIIGANNSYANVIIKGVDPQRVGAVTDLNRNIEQDAGSIARLWPLHDDGGVRAGPPPVELPVDAGPDEPRVDAGLDPVPDDFGGGDQAPADFSGGEDPDAVSEQAAEVTAEQRMRAGTLDVPPEDFPDFDDDAPRVFDEPAIEDALQGAPGLPPPPPTVMPDPIDPDFFRTHRPEEFWPPFDDLDEPGAPGRVVRVNARPTESARVNQLPGVLVGKELEKTLHLYVGQEVSLVSPLGQMTPAGPVPESKPYRVAGVFYTGMYEYDTKVIYVELGSFQSFMHIGDTVDGIEVRVVDPDDTEPAKQAIRARLGPGYEVADWMEINRSLFAALKLEKIAMFLVLAIIVVVASFSIIGNLIMVVIEKAREIALLKTLGASDTGIMAVFVVQGFFIGLVGTAIGVTNGLLTCWGLATVGVPLDPDVYYIDRLPVEVDGLAVVAVVLASIAISVTATLYPAWLGARVRPVDGLRYE